MLDLIIEAAHGHVGARRPPRTLRAVVTWRCTKSSFSPGTGMGIPLWLGAKAHPRYSPKMPCCTAMKATARHGDRTKKTAPRYAAP